MTPFLLAHLPLSKLIYELVFSSPTKSAFGLMQSWCKEAMSLNETWLRRVGHAETTKEEKKENRGHSALSGELKHREFWPFCVSSRVSKNTKRYSATWEVQSVWRDREKHSESVREWKRKRRHFSLLKLHTRKINWWSSHGVFECYNHGKLEYSEENFATGFVVRLYLFLEIYLLYIQFIVDLSLA